jgi:hypothetical protein
MSKNKSHLFNVSESEIRLICFIREFGFGEINLLVQDGNAMLNGMRAIKRLEQDPIFKKILDSDIRSLL